jgi:hypothetical protein
VLRAVRGATLRLRFAAAPLYGSQRRSREVTVGRTTSGRRFERFGDLPAQTYAGVVRYRWVRGKRTVASGLVRTSRARAAGRRGRAFCSLRVGKRPVDTTPPFVLPLPYDSGWRRGPLDVHLYAVDDLSGVALVVWRLDNGPFVRGRDIQITTEGSHELVYTARDAAGNETAPGTVTLRVDTGAPTEPTMSAPSGTTTDSTPELRWTASTDSGSGVALYVALVRDASGAIVWSQFVDPNASLAATVGQERPPGQYTAEVVAADGVEPPHTSKASSSFSVVGSANSSGDSDGDGVADASDNCPFAANADQADLDADASGDACDTDDDGDNVADASDNCPINKNADQVNTDGLGDGGDACDTDDDQDGVSDASDNCRTVVNPKQRNTDHTADALGDACDSDMDGDGIPNTSDSDIDNDGVPNNPNLDSCPYVPRNANQVNGCPPDGDGF